MIRKRLSLLAVLAAGCILLTSCLPMISLLRNNRETILETKAENDLSAAADKADAFMKALINKDTDSIVELSGYSTADFFTEDSSSAVPAAIFGNMTYKIVEDMINEDSGVISVPVSGTIPAFMTAVICTMSDTPLLAGISKDTLYESIWGETTDEVTEKSYQATYDAIADELSGADAGTSSFEGQIYLEQDAKEEWVITGVPEELCDVVKNTTEVNPYESIPNRDAATLAVLDLLVEEGTITQDQRDTFVNENNLDSNDVQTYTSTSDVQIDNSMVLLNIDMEKSSWVDRDSGEPAASYPSGTTEIDYELHFKTLDSVGTPVIIKVFNSTEDDPIASMAAEIAEDSLYVYYRRQDDSVIVRDTYRVIITLKDGSVLVDESVEVN